MLPARPTRAAEAGPPGRRAVAEGVDADPVGAAARLDQAPLLGLADLDPVDDAAGQVLLPELGLFGLPHALGDLERAVARSSAGTLSAKASRRIIIRSSVSEGWRASVRA